MRPLVTITLTTDGPASALGDASPPTRTVALGHGDLIGRLDAAALHISDPRVSEAHAMVSLRGTSLFLLALRGRFTVDNRPLAKVSLRVGMRIGLARGIAFTVDRIDLPTSVLAVRIGTEQSRVLTGVCSVFAQPQPTLKPGFHRDAIAHLWSSGTSLKLRQPSLPDRQLHAGEHTTIGDILIAVDTLPLTPDGQLVTQAGGGVATPLEITVRYDSASVHRAGFPALHLTGISAKILSEVATFGAPVAWETLAGELWPEDLPNLEAGGSREARVRAKWDVNVGRLRKKLQAVGIRPDLVRSDGHGNVELVLETTDRVTDET